MRVSDQRLENSSSSERIAFTHVKSLSDQQHENETPSERTVLRVSGSSRTDRSKMELRPREALYACVEALGQTARK